MLVTLSKHSNLLQICADTVVGDAMLRGISGGQKKRVTTAEMVVGPKKTLFLDEISTGLVSARLDFVAVLSVVNKSTGVS